MGMEAQGNSGEENVVESHAYCGEGIGMWRVQAK